MGMNAVAKNTIPDTTQVRGRVVELVSIAQEAHSGQTSRACAVPARTGPYKRLKFPTFLALKPNVSEKLRLIRRL